MMQSEYVFLTDIGNPVAIAQALQQAIDRVLDRQRVYVLAARHNGGQAHVTIFPNRESPSIGSVTLHVGGHDDGRTILSVVLYMTGYHANASGIYVAEQALGRIQVGLDGLATSCRGFQRRHPSHNWVEARLCFGTQTFRDYPRALVAVGE